MNLRESLAPASRDDALSAALKEALRGAGLDLGEAALEPLRDSGLAHDHVRLVETGLLARLPKQSQMGLRAQENLDYQAACYRRAGPTGAAPRLDAIIPPCAALPRGGLLVEEIEGRPARLPDDLPAIMRALARIHALPLPPPGARPPLADRADPLADLLFEIETQAAHLDAAGVAGATGAIIAGEVASLRDLTSRPERPARRLISFDAHPGNFLIRPDGSAVLVDLEKCRYSAPALDLAHATLYTSTTWDVESHAVLDADETREACRIWLDELGDDDARRWIAPLRRAMWMWSLTWCAKWRALSARPAGGDGEDWSAERSDAALIAHVRDRVDHYLHPDTAARVAADCAALAAALDDPT